MLSDSDVLHALHLDRACAALRDMQSALAVPGKDPLIIRLLSSFATVNDIVRKDKDIQTNPDMDDVLNVKLREFAKERNHSALAKSNVIEERLMNYQRQLETQIQQDALEQLERFKDIELAQMRLDERKQYNSDLAKHKAEFEAKLIDAQNTFVSFQEREQSRLSEKEKLLEQQNLELRQKLLDENNRLVMKEIQLRNDAELHSKELKLERDLLQKRFEEVQSQVTELQSFKERYTQKTEEAMAQFKIDLNKEYSGMLSAVEIEKSKLEAERMVLKEKSIAVEKMHASIRQIDQERDALQTSLKEVTLRLEETTHLKEDAQLKVKELELEVLTQRGSSAVEFEISSLKKQLIEAERMAEKRQEEYQTLLKSLVVPQDDLRNELNKSRLLEAKWHRECQQLVVKLDLELNRTDELQQRLDDEVLRNKELHRELADTRLLLHQAQLALTNELTSHANNNLAPSRTPRMQPSRMLLPDPLDPNLDDLYSKLSTGHHVRSERPTFLPTLSDWNRANAADASQPTEAQQQVASNPIISNSELPIQKQETKTIETQSSNVTQQEDEEAAVKRLQEERQAREKQREQQKQEEMQRLLNERAELERQQLVRQAEREEQERKRKESEERRAKELELEEADKRRLQEAERVRLAAKASDPLQFIENDPMLLKYMAIVKERKEKETTPGAIKEFVEVKAINSPAVRSDPSSSISNGFFGAGATADEITGDTQTSDPW